MSKAAQTSLTLGVPVGGAGIAASCKLVQDRQLWCFGFPPRMGPTVRLTVDRHRTKAGKRRRRRPVVGLGSADEGCEEPEPRKKRAVAVEDRHGRDKVA